MALQDRTTTLDGEIQRGRETIEAERRAASTELRDRIHERGRGRAEKGRP